jgi:hypothetical protein
MWTGRVAGENKSAERLSGEGQLDRPVGDRGGFLEHWSETAGALFAEAPNRDHAATVEADIEAKI